MSETANRETPCPDACPEPAFASHEQMHELYGQPLVYGLKMHINYIHVVLRMRNSEWRPLS
jgi:hypothetical protein